MLYNTMSISIMFYKEKEFAKSVKCENKGKGQFANKSFTYHIKHKIKRIRIAYK
jgi:hypothetical protein